MSKKDNFYLIILSLVLMMFRPGTTTLITTRSLVAPFMYSSESLVSINGILIRIDKFLAFFGVLLFFYLSIVLLLKVFRGEST
ncbi:MAG TPA: hypothetical protein VFC60_02150 [Tissierellaceae bacterium]|nr:hypothetical protein [Tissierellaceae bacterium]